MDKYGELSIDEWRAKRLEAAVDELDGGNKTQFGKRMGYGSGRYIQMMITMDRPITEKFIMSFEDKTGLVGWFDRTTTGSLGSLEQQIRRELSQRDVPEHTLRAFLDSIRAYPPRRKMA